MQVAEAGAALAVAVPPLLILLRLVAGRRLLLRVQVVVEVVVRVKVAATRRLQVGLQYKIRIGQNSTCVNGLGGGFIFPFLWSDLREINVRFISCIFFVEITSSLFEILI